MNAQNIENFYKLQSFLTNGLQSNGLPEFASFTQVDTKHDHDFDYGYPYKLTFQHLYQLYKRHAAATSLVDKTAQKTWESFPEFRQSEESDGTEMLEKGVNRHLKKIRFWQKVKRADQRSLVGNYSALIFRFADGQEPDQPVRRMNGINNLVDVIPCWQGQLVVTHWDQDRKSPRYGQPLRATYNEAAVDPKTGQTATFNVHWTRFVIWSPDMTTFGNSPLEASYNALVDMLKIRGGGAEGFWRNAKQRFALVANNDNIDFNQLADFYGVDLTDLPSELSKIMSKWQKSFDQTLAFQGLEPKTIPTDLPVPEHYHNVAAMEAASGFDIPTRVWFGNQTGERASSEDQAAWSRSNMARREDICEPNIDVIFERFQDFGLLPVSQGYQIYWVDLTDDTPDQRIERAKKMTEINKNNEGTGDAIFSADEIRIEAGYEPNGDDDLSDFEDDDEDEIDADLTGAGDDTDD